MNESSSTTPTEEITRSGHCSIPWCVKDHSSPRSDQDHYAGTDDDGPFPAVIATGTPTLDPYLVQPLAHWAVSEDLDPVVSLYAHGGTGSWYVDASIDLRPGEARRLAALLIHAADAADATPRA